MQRGRTGLISMILMSALAGALVVVLAASSCTHATRPSHATTATAPPAGQDHRPMDQLPTNRGQMLARLTWMEAEKILTPETIVVIPLGAGSKEHGPHLKLENDAILAEYFTRRVLAGADVVITPLVNTHFYPAFVEYPGSISLSFETARALIADICRSLARFGPRRFYVLNTGVSTMRPLAASAEDLAREGILLHYTNLLEAIGPVEKEVSEQPGGTHADEIETSMILYIDPVSVDMSKAVKDYQPDRPGGLTRDPGRPGTYSPTGVWGDATLATREKGERIVEALVVALLRDLDELRTAPLPTATATPTGSGTGQPP
jgi:creatinine amidohydrolase